MSGKRTLQRIASAGALLSVCGLCGCVVVGYTTSGGWFFWPRGLALLVVLLLVLLLAWRR